MGTDGFTDISRCFNCRYYNPNTSYCSEHAKNVIDTHHCPQFIEFTNFHPDEFQSQRKISRPNSYQLTALQRSDYLQMLNNELDSNIVGEKHARKTILLVAIGGSITINAKPTSKNLLINDESGAGKDYIVKNTLSILPTDWLYKRARLSPKVLTYWNNANLPAYKDWTWDGKVLYIEDVPNILLNEDVFKVFLSSEGENASTVLVNQKVVEILVRGKPVVILTSYSANPKNENLRRLPMLSLNVTKEQTELILKRQAEDAITGLVPKRDAELIQSIECLMPVKVLIPFAKMLPSLFSTESLIMRTHFPRFLDYIRFSAGIHQYSRERTPEGFIIASGDDYSLARSAILATSSNKFSIPLSKVQKKILGVFESLPRVMDDNDKEMPACYSIKELGKHITFINQKSTYTECDKLADAGILFKTDKEGDSGRTVMAYGLKENQSLMLPSWADLQNPTNNTKTTNSTK